MTLCGAGSLLGIGLSEGSFPVGKVDFLHLSPMSFEKYLLAIEDNKSYDFLRNLRGRDSIPDIVHSHLWQQLKNYFVVGGLPENVQIYRDNKENIYNAFKLVRENQNILITAYTADIAKHSGKQNSMHIERLWRNVPYQLAREQNGSASKFRFKGVIPRIKGYSRLVGAIDWLITAGLLLKARIANSGGLPFPAHIQENQFKLYLFNVGILGALSKLPARAILEYNYGSYKGYFAENFVAQEFIFSGESELTCWKENTAEVEFLREIDARVFPIEIKSGWITQAKSLKVFASKYNPPYRTIMSARNMHFDYENKIYRYPLYLASHFPLV